MTEINRKFPDWVWAGRVIGKRKTMTETTVKPLPWWMPAWLWSIAHTSWFASITLGMAAYFLLSMVNDITGTIPLWIRLATEVLATLVVRLGIALEWRRSTHG
jgi:hypothetical protein